MNLFKKAQGLPINTIILIAIGLLILVLFITFVLGGFSGISGGTNPNAQAEAAFAQNCNTYCTESQSTGNSASWCTYPNTTIGGTAYSCATVPGGSSTCTINSVVIDWKVIVGSPTNCQSH